MNRKLRILVLIAFVFSLAALVPSGNKAAAACSGQFVAETQHCVPTLFWNYWNSHGGLAQQGYPVSEAAMETASDGKQYLTQYFERAVFEYHPENAGTAYEVLLAQLGSFRLHDKYPNGAAGTYNWPSNNHNFSQTGQTVGGKFYDYWASHGGLAQQGYPISGVFQEKSDTNGQTYYVQYFERAEFEWHQENAGSASEVLLTLLGAQRYAQVNGQAHNPPDPCAGVHDGYYATITPKCGTKGTVFTITLLHFAPDEKLSYWFTDPQGNVIGTQAPQSFGSHGGNIQITFDSSSAIIYTSGDWAVTFQGENTNVQSVAYFRILK
jgi:hypothetical protein